MSSEIVIYFRYLTSDMLGCTYFCLFVFVIDPVVDVATNLQGF